MLGDREPPALLAGGTRSGGMLKPGAMLEVTLRGVGALKPTCAFTLELMLSRECALLARDMQAVPPEERVEARGPSKPPKAKLAASTSHCS